MLRSAVFGLAFLVLASCSGGTAPPTAAPTPERSAGATTQATSAPTASLTSSPTATGSGTSGSAYQQLMASIPPVIASTCTQDDSSAQMERALAVAYCEPEDVIVDPDVTIDRLMYFLVDSDERRIDLWAGYWEALGEPANGECATGPATSLYEVDGLPVGRLVCAPWPQTSNLAAWWYDDRLNVVMTLRIDGGYEDLANLVEAVSVQL